MTYNTDRFLASVEKAFGPLHVYQRQGFAGLILESVKHRITDDRWTAYMLATAWHETACTMQPIAEYGKGKGHPYGVPKGAYGQIYYGRGFVQLTWESNYKKAEERIKALTGTDYPLHSDASQALIPDVASLVLFVGMSEGWFTGKKLSDYFSGSHEDPVGARRIINGTDKASTIAGYYRTFLNGLRGAQDGKEGSQATMVAEGSPKAIPEAPVKVEVQPVVIPSPPIVHPAPSAASPTLGEVLWGYLKAKLHGS